jgi:arginyl-tRNA synthetase
MERALESQIQESLRHERDSAELINLRDHTGRTFDLVRSVIKARDLMNSDASEKGGDATIALIRTASAAHLQPLVQSWMLERQRRDLDQFGVRFDVWFSEQSMHESGEVKAAISKMIEMDRAYRSTQAAGDDEEPGDQGEALWLRSSAFGDDKDRVLVRSDGRPAYIAGDLAYMRNKLGVREFDKSLLILGPDHHGYIGRMNAVCQVQGFDPDRFEIIIFQIVRFMRDGKPAPMRKRDGNIYERHDLVTELGKSAAPDEPEEEQIRIGRDVARFFYLMRSHDTHMDFDIDLATKQSDENPVFYAQYAHARICSVLRKAEEGGIALGSGEHAALLTHPCEIALIKKTLDLPFEVRRCAQDYGVHRLTTFAVELARAYHHFYDACRVIQRDQPELTQARLALCQAAKIGLQATFKLLGVSAPESMSR